MNNIKFSHAQCFATSKRHYRKGLGERSRNRRYQCPALLEVSLTSKQHGDHTITKDEVTIGAGQAADIPIQGEKVAPEHAKLLQDKGSVYLVALVGDASTFKGEAANSYTWIDGSQARPQARYILHDQAQLAFGDESATMAISFKEQQSLGPMADILVQGFMQQNQFSEDMQKKMEDSQ